MPKYILKILWIVPIFLFLIVGGTFLAIDKLNRGKIVSTNIFSDYKYQISTKIYKGYFDKKDTQTPAVKFQYKNSSIELSLPDSDYKVQNVGNDKVEYKKGNTQINYTTSDNGIKEEIVLTTKEENALVKYTFTLNRSSMKIVAGIPYFYDEKGRYVFHFSTPFAKDNKGITTKNVNYVIEEKGKGEYTLMTVVDEKWLNDKKRAFPVIIDPTIIHTPPDEPLDNATGVTIPVAFTVTGTDTESDYLRYKIEVCENREITVGCQTFDQTSSQTGWTGQDTQTGTAYTSGTTGTYTSSNFTYGKTYYWRSYAIDPGGSNLWSTTEATPRAFTTNAYPRPATSSALSIFSARRISELSSTTVGWTSITGSADSGTTGSTNGWISSTNFTPGKKYLILATGSHSTDNTSGKSGIKVTHGTITFENSESVDITNNTTASYKTPYFWFTVWTAVSGESLEAQMYWNGVGGQSRVEDVSLIAIDADTLIANGDLKYSQNTTYTNLTTSFTNQASLTFTPSNNNDNWWIMGYNQTSLNNGGTGSKFENRIDINSVGYSYNLVTVNADSIGPIYPTGYVTQLSNSSNTISIQAKEYVSDQIVDASGLFALRLNSFEDYLVSSKELGTSTSSIGSWTNNITSYPLNSLNSSNWIVMAGGSINDYSSKSQFRLQSAGSNISDDIGGWQKAYGDKTPIILGDYILGLTSGSKNITFDGLINNSFSNPTYTLNDGFSTDYGVGTLNGTAAEPTGGTRTVVDTNLKIYTSGGALVIKAGPAYGNPGLWYSSQTRSLGKILTGEIYSYGGQWEFGFDTAQSGALNSNSFWANGTTLYGLRNGGSQALETLSTSITYKFALVLKTSGAYYYIKGGTFSNWTLVWVDTTDSTSTLYPGIIGYTDSNLTADNIRIPTTTWLPKPLAHDTFTRSDGAIGSSETTGPDGVSGPTVDSLAWTGGTISSNKNVITPTLGNELVTNGGMESDSNWTNLSTPTTNERSVEQVRSGTYSRKVVTDAGYEGIVSDTFSPTIQQWGYFTGWAYPNVTSNLLIESGGGGVSSSSNHTGGTWSQFHRGGRFLGPFTETIRLRPIVAGTWYFDDVSVKPLTLSSLFSTISTNDTDVITDANITLTVGTQAGIATNLNTNFTSGIVAYLTRGATDASSNIKLDKFTTTTTWTNLIAATTVTYVQDATLRVITYHSDANTLKVRVYYNNSLVGTEQTITDVSIISNTRHGLFSTYSGNTFDNFTLWARGTGSEYQEAPFEEPTTMAISYPWMVGFSREILPNYSSMDLPTNTNPSVATRPQIKTTAIDPDSNYLRYKIQLCTDLAMTQNCQTFDQTSSQTGWSGQNTQSNTAYTSGTQATYTLQTDLTAAETYYWRSYTIDPSGTNTFTSANPVPYSFTVTTAPLAPTSLLTEGAENATGITDTTPEFSAIHNDPEGDASASYQLQVNTQADFAGTSMWDSGKTTLVVNNGARSADISYAGTTLSLLGTKYYWRIKFWDSNDTAGTWSVTAEFTMKDIEYASSCYIVQTKDDSSITINWKDNTTLEDGYKIQRKVDSGSFTDLITKAANAITHTDATISQGHTYQYRVAPTKNSIDGTWCTTDVASVFQGSIKFEGLKLEGVKID